MELFPLIFLFFIVAVVRSVFRTGRRSGLSRVAAVMLLLVVFGAILPVASSESRAGLSALVFLVAFFSVIVGILVALVRRARRQTQSLPDLRVLAPRPARRPSPPPARTGRLEIPPPSSREPTPAATSRIPPPNEAPAPAPTPPRPRSTPVAAAAPPPATHGTGRSASPQRRKSASTEMVEQARRKYYPR